MALDEVKLTQLLKLVATRSNAKIRTAIPGRILAFDKDTQVATVQPAIDHFYYDVDAEAPAAETPEPITNCPVHFPYGGGFFSGRFPLVNGDDCILLVAERSIDEWMATGNAQNTPRDLRRFDLTDAIVLPGLLPRARAWDDFDDTCLEIGEAAPAGLRIKIGGGKIEISAGGTALLATLSALAGAISTAATAAGTYAAAAGTAWTALGQTAASTAAGTWATAAGGLATAATTAKTAIDLLKRT